MAALIKKVVGFKGGFVFNTDKPDGTMRKVTDVSKLHSLGWKHAVELEKGVEMMYDWYLHTSNKSTVNQKIQQINKIKTKNL